MIDDELRQRRIADLLAIIESELTPAQRVELERLRRLDRAAVHPFPEATDEQIAEARRLFDLETARVKGERDDDAPSAKPSAKRRSGKRT